MADTYFVGKLDNSASAGVGVALPVMAIIQALGFFCGFGSGNFISRSLGEKDTDSARKMASVGFFSAIVLGGIIAVFGELLIDPLVNALGATETNAPYAKDYIRILLIGAPFMMGAYVLNNQIRFQGNASYSMIGITSGAILNVFLDPVFITTLGMGTAGAALATIVSQLISFIILLFVNIKTDCLTINIKNFLPSVYLYKEICIGGAPSLLRQGLSSVSTLFLNRIAKEYGIAEASVILGISESQITKELTDKAADIAITAMSVVSKVMFFASSALIGFGQGFQPVCAFNYGAKKYARVREAFKFCVVCATIFLLIISLAYVAFAPELIKLVRNDDRVISLGVKALNYQCLSLPFMGLVIMSNMMLQSMGKVVRASVLAVARQGMFFIPAIIIAPMLLGLNGVLISQTISDFLSFALALPIQISIMSELKKAENLEPMTL
jgi:Na+-driven multidrug efflux pump